MLITKKEAEQRKRILDNLPWVYGSHFFVQNHKMGDLPPNYEPRHLYLTVVPTFGKEQSERAYLGCCCRPSPREETIRNAIREAIGEFHPAKPFAAKLKELIRVKRPDLKRVSYSKKCELIYQEAGISKTLFYAIVSCAPSGKKKTFVDKATVVSIAFALKLNLDETNDLLGTLGMFLTDDLLEDRLYAMCIKKGYYDVPFVNDVLGKKGIGTSKFLKQG